ncbi:DPP IV N-terminal domain-containing protein [Lysobacter sp. GX 14042]|uniref:S9 family peptidase n=1 Tax=Lysobacter sp. GX 14042 TaxID=2907155 RepID=UPI001F2E157D|nr:DPP IV N-terminal domain-containing protein [Lysobacter sp. GX 14042]MCE7032138.1 DPP IV N-terminal domain-containing protein [Lysobacter sp. GX 14042]
MKTTRPGLRLLGAALGGLLAATATATAQPSQSDAPVMLTHDDYARAEAFMGYNATPLLDHAVTRVEWLDDGRFWYRDHDARGDHYRIFDLATGQAREAFDHAVVAAALNALGGKVHEAGKLELTALDFDADGRLELTIARQQYRCEGEGEALSCTQREAGGGEPAVASPDGRLGAFIRDWNLWVRELDTGKETQLTTDGTEHYGYATDNAGWTHSDRAILVWSPDSTRIATFRLDQRQVSEMVMVRTAVGAPGVERWKYPFAGDEHVNMIERVVIDVPARTLVRLDMEPDFHRSTLCDHISCDGGWEDVQWAPDGASLAFASTSRDHRDTWLRIADPRTGAVREVYHEHAPSYFESGNGKVNWHYLPGSGEFLWFSERSDWGHLYLYGLDGTLKHAVTTGEDNVTQVLRVDPDSRTVWFRGVGMEDGRDPYYQHFYKVSLDGGEPVLLTPENADHTVFLSPDGRHFVDAHSTPATPPVTVLRSSGNGRVLATVAQAEAGRLYAAGWIPPESFTVKARDGVTELYGMLFKPTDFDPSRKYPVVNYIYPGPQTGSVGSRSFSPARRDHQALAELGFIVVTLDGLGTPWRSKSFHDAFDGDIGDNTLPDQVAGLRQLAERHPWLDLERVGVWGHSGGGYATADALFTYPEFYKVGVSQAGNHDNRSYEDDWIEKWMELEVRGADGTPIYEAQANQNRAGNLQGKLLLAHGMMDDNVPVTNTLLLVDALVKANKDFDLIVFPHARHGFGEDDAYMTRRRWDYFVRHLMGAEPPREYRMKAP